MRKLKKVAIRKADGSEVCGHLTRLFNQNATQVELADTNEKQLFIPMNEIECIIFYHAKPSEHPELKLLPNDVVENVFLKSGKTFKVTTDSQQVEFNGFLGAPDPSEFPEIQCIFFVKMNVLGRKMAASFGELLEDAGLAAHQAIETVEGQHQKIKQKRVGDILVDKGMLTRAKLEKAMTSAKGKSRLRVGELLLQLGEITQEQLDQVLEVQKKSKHKKIGEILVETGLIEEDAMLALLAKQLRVRFVNFSNMEPDPSALMTIDASSAHEYGIVPVSLQDNVLMIATSEPNNLDLVSQLQFMTGHRIDLVLAKQNQITEMLSKYYQSSLGELDDFELEGGDEEEDFQPAESLASESEQAPIIRVVNRILREGVEANASDFHIMIRDGKVVVDFRVNGVLSEYMSFNHKIIDPLIARSKVIAKMDISEHRLPQDGRIRMRLPGREVEFRVSCVPSVYGETLVFRIREKKKSGISLETIGLEQDDLNHMQSICQSDHGLILITGPTGSGKSTTMVAAISCLLGKGKRLISLEDPVEIEVSGILQVQVHEKIGFTFGRALRNLLRHDPDIIMVGEIRDDETAEVAIEAALTGHLLFSSLHTNSAAGAFGRLVNMGVEGYLVAATVKGVMAQRLLPKICEHCKTPAKISKNVHRMLEDAHVDPGSEFLIAEGCDKCNNTGISGRVLVYELIEANETLASLIANGEPEHIIKEAAEKDGMRPLSHMAVQKALAGEIALHHVVSLLTE